MNIFYINNITRDKPRSKINFSVINYFPVFLNSHACLPFFDVSFISINHLSKLKGSTSWLLLLTIFEVKNVIRKINVYFKKKKEKKRGERKRERKRGEREKRKKRKMNRWSDRYLPFRLMEIARTLSKHRTSFHCRTW